MKKQIVIIGGGISGLALLHYLKKKYIQHDHVDICLLEKNGHLGGTIRSIAKGGCLFETGPNGFLDSKKRTLEFVGELGLTDSLLRANKESKIRYLSVDGALHQLPTNLKDFLSFKLLNLPQKFRILGEFFIPKKSDPDESVYDFGKRRFGEQFSKIFLDPMVSGIYGGDARCANLKAVFPRIYALEEEYGSLFKAMIKTRKERKAREGQGRPQDAVMGGPSGTLTSFQGGVAQMINAVGSRYKENIHLNRDARSISYAEDRYIIASDDGQEYRADELFVCAPAHSVASMIKGVNNQLSRELEKITYAPIAVVGLVYPLEYFREKPKGYGYLVPSSEESQVLGVLFEGNIFPDRCRDGQILFRVMIGGARHPDILDQSKEELVALAIREIETLVGKKEKEGNGGGLPEHFFIPWEKAIPQYNLAYCEIRKNINSQLRKTPNLHLVANYLNGVSLNDCIESAYQEVQSLSF